MRAGLTLERKLTLILMAFFLSMLLVVVLLLHSLRSEYDKRVYSISSENISNLLSRADSAFSEAMLLGELFVADDFYQTNLSLIKDTEDSTVRRVREGDVMAGLSNLIRTSDYIVDISMLTQYSIIHYGSGIGLSSEAVEEAADMARLASGAALWLGSDDGSVYLIRTIRRLEFLSLDELAVLFIRLDVGSVAAEMRSAVTDNTMILVLSHQGRLLYSEYPDEDGLPDENEIIAAIGDDQYYIYRGILPRSGFSYLVAMPHNSIYSGIVERVITAFAIFLIMLVAFILVLHYIVSRMIARINALMDKMEAFERGQNIGEINALPGSDEIAQLNSRFDRMAQGYKDVVEDNYQRQLIMKDSEIKMLTQQINPHFLYNVLDSIYWMSLKYSADDIASMSYSLAALFRAAVSAEDLITIGKELELLESFLGIQRCRFPDMIAYKVDVDEDVRNTMLPKFSLQPLVENSVKHSVEELGVKTEIVVSAHRMKGGVLLSVSNTGSAFPEDIAEKLKEGKASNSSERIGLQNIDERLCLLFGEGYGLRFRNENGCAIVSFTVPEEV